MGVRSGVVVFLLLAACTSPTTKQPGADGSVSPSSSPAPAVSSAALIEDDNDLYRSGDDLIAYFASPSRNILCSLGSESDADFVSCSIKDHAWGDRWEGPDCGEGVAASFDIGGTAHEGVSLGCGSDAFDPATYRTLPYGHSIDGIHIVCASLTTGMTCRDQRKPFGAFTLSRAAYSVEGGQADAATAAAS